MKAIILAGGYGSRLREVTDDRIPKPLVNVSKKSLLDYNIDLAMQLGSEEIILAVSHLSEVIESEIMGRNYPTSISLVFDDPPVGDAGSFRDAYRDLLGRTEVSERVLLLNSDEIRIGLDLVDMLKLHEQFDALATVAIYHVLDPKNHGIFKFDDEHRATSFEMNPSDIQEGWANTGCYIMEPEVLTLIDENYMLMKKLVPLIVRTDRMYCFPFSGIYHNVGTPKKLRTAEHDIELVRKSLILQQ